MSFHECPDAVFGATIPCLKCPAGVIFQDILAQKSFFFLKLGGNLSLKNLLIAVQAKIGRIA